VNRFKTYEKLYIYTVHGILNDAKDFFGEAILAQWEDSGTTLLFFEAPCQDAVEDFLKSQPGAEYLSETIIDYKNWEAGEPVVATRVAGFLICPTWDIRKPEDDEIRILLDPGVAFGTGLHPTTRCCLRALRKIFAMSSPSKILDLGCGTGILTIASLKLGAKWSTAVDYAAMATERTAECLELNGLGEKAEIICGEAQENLHHEADLVLSNIYIQVISKLMQDSNYISRDWLLISGIHGVEQDEAARGLIYDSGRDIIEQYEEDAWYTYITRRS